MEAVEDETGEHGTAEFIVLADPFPWIDRRRRRRGAGMGRGGEGRSGDVGGVVVDVGGGGGEEGRGLVPDSFFSSFYTMDGSTCKEGRTRDGQRNVM